MSPPVDLDRHVSSSLDRNAVLHSIVHAAADFAGASFAAFWTADEARRTLVGVAASHEAMWADYPLKTVSFDGGVIGEVARTRRAVNVVDVFDDDRVLAQEWFRRHGLRSYYGIPIVDGDSVLGVLSVKGTRPFRLRRAQQERLASFADQAASAIRTARLATSERRRRSAKALADISRALARSLDHRVVADRIVESLSILLNTHMTVLYRIEPASGDLHFVAGSGPTVDWNRVLPRGTATVGRAVLERRVVSTPDVLSDPSVTLAAESRQRIERSGYHAVLAAPLKLKERVIGAIAVGAAAGRVFDDEEVELLRSFADQAAVALENAKIYRAQQQRAARLQSLAKLNQLISSSLNTVEVLTAITRAAAELMEAAFVSVWLADEKTRTLRAAAASDDRTGPDYTTREQSFDDGVIGRVATERRPISIPDVHSDDRIVAPEWFRQHGLSSYYGVPIICQERILGVLNLVAHAPLRFDADHQELLESFAGQAALAIRNAGVFAESERRRQAAESLAEVSRLLTQSLDVRVVAQRILDNVGRLVRAHSPSLYRLGPTGALVALAVSSDLTSTIQEGFVFPPGTGMGGLAVRLRETVTTPNLLADPRVVLTPEMRRRLEGAPYRALLSVPLMVKDQVIGVLSIGDREGRIFDDVDIRIAQAFADQAALALANARLFEETERRRKTAEALTAVGRLLSQSLNLEEVAERISESVRTLLGVSNSALFEARLDAHELVSLCLKGDHGPGDRPIVYPIGYGAVGVAAKERHPIVTADLLDDPRIPQPPEQRARMEQAPFRAVLALPLLLQDRMVGVLVLGDRAGRVFSEEEVGIAQAFADQATVAMENARLYQESESQRKHLATLVEVSQRVTRGLDLPSVLASIADAAAQLFEGEAGFRLVQDDELVRVGATAGALPAMARERLRLGESISGLVAATGEPIVTPDSEADPRLSPDQRAARAEHPELGSIMCVPIRLGDHVLGTLNIYRERGHRFGALDLKMAMSFADQAAIAVANARLYTEATEQAGRMKALSEIGRTLSETLDLDVVGQRITDSIRSLLSLTRVTLYRLDPRTGDLTALAKAAADASTLAGRVDHVPAGTAVVGRAVEDRTPVWTADLLHDPRITLTPLQRERMAASEDRAVLAVPLIAQDGVIGALSLGDRTGRVFHDEEIGIARAFADQAALSLKNAEVLKESRTRQLRLETLLEINRQLSMVQPIDVLLHAVAASAVALFGDCATSVWVIDHDGERVALAADAGLRHPESRQRTTLAPGEGIIGRAIEAQRPVVFDDLQQEPLNSNPALSKAEGFHAAVVVPLVFGGRCYGALSVRRRAHLRFRPEEVDLLASLAGQAASAIENSRLYEGLREKNERLQELFEIAGRATVSLTLSDVIPTLVKAAAGLAGHDAASIGLLDPSGTLLLAVAHHGLSDTFAGRGPVAVGEGVAGQVVLDGQPMFIESLTDEQRHGHREHALAEGIRAMAVVPLRSRDRNIGVLHVYARSERRYREPEIELLSEFANVAAITIENAQLYEQAQVRAARMKRLNQLGQMAGSSLDAQHVLDFVVGAAGELLRGDLAHLWVIDEATGAARLAAGTDGEGQAAPSGGDELRPGQGVVGWVVERREKYYAANVVEDPRFVNKAWARAGGYVSMITVPLVAGEAAVGALAIMTRSPRIFTHDEEELLELFAGKAAIALVNARLHEATQRALGEVKAKNAELDSFVYSVSHDLKAPLVTIQGMASLLLADCTATLDERGRHYLRRIEANVGQMECLISDLLALSRIGREARPAEQVSLTEVADEALAGLVEPIGARGVKVVCHELGSVWGVRTHLKQVLANLIGNAVKYLGDSPDPQVEIGAADRGEWVECYIRDNGIGIDPAYHAQVFELFQRLKEIPAEGTGVGLAVVKKIVEAAGGRVWVESAKGHGATFSFTWPTTTRPA